MVKLLQFASIVSCQRLTKPSQNRRVVTSVLRRNYNALQLIIQI